MTRRQRTIAFFVGLWEGLKRRQATMHTLIATGTSVAWLYSTVVLLFPDLVPSIEMADVYYDVTVVVTALVVLGLALEVKARGRTSEAIRKLIGLQPKTARVIRDGQERDLPVEEVLVGDLVVVRPGEKIPVDGIVEAGASTARRIAPRMARTRGSATGARIGPAKPSGHRGSYDQVGMERKW